MSDWYDRTEKMFCRARDNKLPLLDWALLAKWRFRQAEEYYEFVMGRRSPFQHKMNVKQELLCPAERMLDYSTRQWLMTTHDEVDEDKPFSIHRQLLRRVRWKRNENWVGRCLYEYDPQDSRSLVPLNDMVRQWFMVWHEWGHSVAAAARRANIFESDRLDNPYPPYPIKKGVRVFDSDRNIYKRFPEMGDLCQSRPVERSGGVFLDLRGKRFGKAYCIGSEAEHMLRELPGATWWTGGEHELWITGGTLVSLAGKSVRVVFETPALPVWLDRGRIPNAQETLDEELTARIASLPEGSTVKGVVHLGQGVSLQGREIACGRAILFSDHWWGLLRDPESVDWIKAVVNTSPELDQWMRNIIG